MTEEEEITMLVNKHTRTTLGMAGTTLVGIITGYAWINSGLSALDKRIVDQDRQTIERQSTAINQQMERDLAQQLKLQAIENRLQSIESTAIQAGVDRWKKIDAQRFAELLAAKNPSLIVPMELFTK